MQDDIELLRRYAETRSEEAFAELVRRHVNLVYFSALRRTRGATHLAEDVSQLVFIALARHATSLQRDTVLAGWLFVATRNAAAKTMRTEQRRMTREQEAYAMLETLTDATADWERIRPHLDAALDDLDPRDRDVVLLRFMENRPFAEIGGVLRVSDDAARMRVDRALDKLRVSLVRRGITSTTGALAIALGSQAATTAPASLVATIGKAVLASGAGAGAGVAIGLFKFMNPTTLAIGSGVACLVSIGAAFYQADQARQTSAALATEQKTSGARIQFLQAKLAATETSAAIVKTTPAVAAAPAAAEEETQKKRKKSGVPPPPATPFTELMKDPVYANAWRQLTLREIDHRYGYFRGLNLDADRLARVRELLLNGTAAGRDANEAARQLGLTVEEMRKAVAQANEPWFEQVKLLIGEEGLAQLKRTSNVAGVIPTIMMPYVFDLSAAGVPLVDTQFMDFGTAFSDFLALDWPKGTGWSPQVFTEPKNVDAQSGLNPHAQALLKRFASYLTPAQIEALKANFIEETSLRRITDRM
jgi:RNA polymerase sigma factor (sigma-70 family)